MIIGIGLLIFYLIILEYRIKDKETNPKSTNCSEKVEYFNYVINKQKHTDDAV